ncbi:MAG TPA: hypothetical protein VJW51_02210 [Candidatus Acidoferrales bacterium]|nr:hypothetical protein [Candidatus Acidoferrales bacterium]
MSPRHSHYLILAMAAACGLTIAVPALQAQQGANPGPVGGVAQYNVGELPPERSFVIPRLSFQEVWDSNPGYSATTSSGQGDEITSLSGGVTLQAVNRNSLFSLFDSTTGLIYDRQTQPNAVVQQLNVTEKLSLRRWNLLIGENFSYLPNSAFGLGGLGFTGAGTTGLPGIGAGTGFNPYVTPTQTIESPNVSQISSATVVQAQYAVNPTSSVNFSGTVGFLHFLGNDLLNSRNVTARFGYDKSFTAKDTISFSYMASILDYPSGLPGFTSHYVQVGYRRLLKQRLFLSLSAGPAISQFSPQVGQTTVPGGAISVDWSTFSTLSYVTRNGSVSAQYTHGISGGSGYLPGASSDQLSVSLTRQASRVWMVGFSGGYARNSSLEQTSPAGMAATTTIFNTWFGGASVSRPVGHYSNLRFFYNASRQTGNTTMCVGGISCGPVALTQTAGMSFTWATRPLPLD